jgi:hypothetical protein
MAVSENEVISSFIDLWLFALELGALGVPRIVEAFDGVGRGRGEPFSGRRISRLSNRDGFVIS